MELNVPVIDQSALGGRGYFFVGGSCSGEPGRHHLCGQMFVEVYVPVRVTEPYPIIFIHGAGQTNLNWLGTPDGRPGWADYFIRQGYTVYLCEQPARGRSAYHPEENGPRIYHPIEVLQNRFTSAEGKWPRAALHTQWPEAGAVTGTPVFRQFAAQQVESLASNKESQELVMACAGELLEKTGPAILLTHSQAGPFGFSIADAYPEKIKAILSVEPGGPPFVKRPTDTAASKYWISDVPLHFEPPVSSPAEFSLARCTEHRDFEDDGWILADTARYSLPRLKGIPIAILTGEASYHTQYDYLTSAVLNQLSVPHDFIRLEDVGICGNGHMMMFETNNLEIAAFMDRWLREHLG